MNRQSHLNAKFPSRPRAAIGLGLLLASVAIPCKTMADHGLPHVEVLAQGSFIEDVSTTIKWKDFYGGAKVFHLQDASDMFVIRAVIEAGGIAPWHTHTGTGMLINMGPGTATNVVGDDCEPRDYLPNEAFVDPGHGELHAVRNDSDEEVELLIVFFGVEGSPITPVGGGPHDCEFLD